LREIVSKIKNKNSKIFFVKKFKIAKNLIFFRKSLHRPLLSPPLKLKIV